MVAILPILKLMLPALTQIASNAIPAFTAKPEAVKVDPVVAKQIEELQAAATKNAESIHILAEKLQQSIQSIDTGAGVMQKEIAKLKLLLVFSSSIAVFSLVLVVLALLR